METVALVLPGDIVRIGTNAALMVALPVLTPKLSYRVSGR